MKKPKSRTYDFADGVVSALDKLAARAKNPFNRMSVEDQERVDAAAAKRQRRQEKRK